MSSTTHTAHTAHTEAPGHAAWHHRLAVATVATAVPLLLFGGTVTSLEAGMAIDGWWVLEPGRGDHFLLFYPVEKWFRDAGTFVEHTHRLFGALVGLLAIATCVLTWRLDERRSARLVSLAGLLAVCGQGALGGFRVLENSPELAFVHGAVAQLVFALLAAVAVFLSPRWRRYGARGLASSARAVTDAPRAGTWLAAVLVYATIFLGAWLRHAASVHALAVHALVALLASGVVLSVALRLRHLGAEPATVPLRAAGLSLLVLLGAQLLLGAASYWIVFVSVGPTIEEVHQSVFPTLHVLTGALLLAQAVAAALWTGRIAGRARAGARADGGPALATTEEGAR